MLFDEVARSLCRRRVLRSEIFSACGLMHNQISYSLNMYRKTLALSFRSIL